MRVFNCDHCGHLLFFDSVQCLHCGAELAFVPDDLCLHALQPSPGHEGLWQGLHPWASQAPHYRMCANRELHQACNFAVPSGDDNPYCVSCRQTHWLPDLSDPANLRRWKAIEDAKRRLYYTLARLRLTGGQAGTAAPVFEFLADTPQAPVMTGHRQGTITLNVAEADDDERARRRLALGEPYRTLVGHLRHESGHFFWEALVASQPAWLERFRSMFGDERQDYAQSLQTHYAKGPAGEPGWPDTYVSAYAAAHPWEDWAETWAHYLHLVDLLETAASYQTTLTVPGGAALHRLHDPFMPGQDFDAMLADWIPLTLLLNSLNASLGQQHAYPFALSHGALAKLRFVHELLQERSAGPAPAAVEAYRDSDVL